MIVKCIILVLLLVLLYCEKNYTDSSLVIKHANEVSNGTKKHFPAETMRLVIGQANQNGVTGKADKTSPTPKK